MKPARPLITAIALLLFMGCTAPALAQETTNTKVDEYVNAEMRRAHIPGLSVAVMRNGQIILAKGYGLANVEHQVPVKPETIFQSGSMGKQFTATAVMMLVEEGKLSLSDSITKYFTDAPASWQPITVRHLLTHTGGMTDYPRDFDFRRDYTEEELLKRAEAIPLAFQPGEKWSYSNLGYVMLGILIHKVSGQFYGDFLQDRVFKPLGMTTTRIISEADIIPNRAAGYTLVKGELKNQDWVSPTLNTTADGALYFTVYDLAKWDAALYTEKLLKRSSLDQMWTPVKLNSGKTQDYGFGWSLGEVNQHHIIEHGGAWQGFKSHIARYVDDKLTVVVLANLAQSNPTRIAHGIAAVYNPGLAPPAPKPIEDKEPEVTALVKRVLHDGAEGKFELTLFTPEQQAQLSASAAQQREFLKSLGPLKSIELLARTEQENGNRLYRYRLTFQTGVSYGVLILTKEGKIASLRLQSE
jgi:CubicO group peptidase (beta-lactamase class C family)